MRAGPSTEDVALLMVGGSGDLAYYADDNIAVDRLGRPLPQVGRYTTTPLAMTEMKQAPALPFGVRLLPASKVQDAVIADAGARPWDRDDIDRRILADTVEGRGKIIDSENEVGGYPKVEPVRQAFVAADWDLATMEPLKPLPRRAPLR